MSRYYALKDMADVTDVKRITELAIPCPKIQRGNLIPLQVGSLLPSLNSSTNFERTEQAQKGGKEGQ